jgi:hypothetical protein
MLGKGVGGAPGVKITNHSSSWYQCHGNGLIRCSIAQAANGLDFLGVVIEI